MNVQFSKKQKYLYAIHRGEPDICVSAALPFRRPHHYAQDPGVVNCWISGQFGQPLFYRDKMTDNQEVRNLYVQIAALIPDAEAIKRLYENELMENLL